MDEKKVLEFWFGRGGTPRFKRFWFEKSFATDRKIKERFGKALEQAKKGRLKAWAATPRGRLALIILLDQFSRNIFRGDARSFAADAYALRLTKEALKNREDRKLHPLERIFLYMPLMHSEKRSDQAKSVALFTKLKMKENLWYAKEHKRVIDTYGRFPHRNAILKRRSTKKELEYLAKPGAGF
ncbi:DUF924 domain-containing protein [bacterium]|nr:DUF924 domain-containing protein [bacterium]